MPSEVRVCHVLRDASCPFVKGRGAQDYLFTKGFLVISLLVALFSYSCWRCISCWWSPFTRKVVGNEALERHWYLAICSCLAGISLGFAFECCSLVSALLALRTLVIHHLCANSSCAVHCNRVAVCGIFLPDPVYQNGSGVKTMTTFRLQSPQMLKKTIRIC